MIEEEGIFQAGAEHALMAADSELLISNGIVVDCDKIGQQLAAGTGDRKIFLMLAHGGDQHLSRQGKEFLLKAAADPVRFFHQIGDNVQQALIK